MSSSQVEDVRSSVGAGRLSTITDIFTEDDIGLKLNSLPNCDMRDKTSLGMSADSTTEKTEHPSVTTKLNMVTKQQKSNESVQSLKGDTKKVPDEPKSKNKIPEKNYSKLQKTSK